MVQVAFGIEAVGLSRFQKSIDGNAGVGAVLGITEEPVLPADDNGADRVLHLVVADLDLTVFEERAKVLIQPNLAI